MADLTGRDIGRYHIVEQLGQGGMAAVYKAYDTRLEREVAIKVIRFTSSAPELVEEMLKRFEREAKSLAKMVHSNIVPIHDYGEFEGSPYLVMAYIQGGTLKDLVGKPMDYHRAAQLLAPIARALSYAHSHGVIHRDIKPSNILLTTAGEPMLSDFGVAKIIEEDTGTTLTTTGVGIGTPEYMAPEQWENKVSPQSDIYALGVVFYELVTGRVPFKADTPIAVLRMQLEQPLPRPKSFVSGLPDLVERVLFKALAKKPANRYTSMDEFAFAMEGLAEDVKKTQPRKPGATGKIDAVMKVEHVPTILATGLPEEAMVRAGQQETQPQPDSPAQKHGWRIPVWGYILGGLMILGLVGGLWALKANGGPKATPTAALVAQATETLYFTMTPAAALVFPTGTSTLMPSVTAGNSIKIGLVTDTGGVNDKSFNQSAWAGVQKAGADFGFDVKFIESKQPTDYEKNIDAFATQKYDVIITVGYLMSDATAAKAKQYPNIKFAIIDYEYTPTKGVAYCDETKKDCYKDGGLTNVTSLMFQEDQVGFLAGVLAAGMSKTGTICTVSGMAIPPVVRYVTGYQNGAKWYKPSTKTLNVYIPSFSDPAAGKKGAIDMIDQGCDVVFSVGGNTGNGGLLAAKEANLMAIGVDVDQYLSYPQVDSVLMSSAMKNVDTAVYNYLQSVFNKTVAAGALTANIKNGGEGLAPFHDWDNKIPADVKAKINEAINDLKSGTITTGYTP